MSSASAIVFLVDDDPSVRRALTRLIRSAGYEVKPFGSARGFLDSDWRGEGVACLVLDVYMPGLSGMELQRELRAANANLPIIFITGRGDIPMSVKAMKSGAVDFLPKPVKDSEILRAIEQALGRAMLESARNAEVQEIQRRLNTLTPREREVMEQVVTGKMNKQIAYELGTVEKTIKVHRSRVMEKMGAESVAELVRVAGRAGLGTK